jgi:CheY-like chemotaxis protein
MITRLRDQSSITQAFANGATDYIKKPFDAFEVLTRINVAERLVQERQAAIDSYAGIRSVLGYMPPALSAQHLKNNDVSAKSEAVQLRLEGLLTLPVFRNYLEQVAETEGCDTRLFAIGIRNIERVFARIDAADFLKFLEAFTCALKGEFGAEDTFLSHAGNGTILCATRRAGGFAPEESQLSIYIRLKDHYPRRWDFALVPDDIVSGRPIRLNKTQKLNFKRAVKAALARLDQRASDTRDLNLSKRAG